MQTTTRLTVFAAAFTLLSMLATGLPSARAQEHPTQSLGATVDATDVLYGLEMATHGRWLFVSSHEPAPSGQLVWNGNTNQYVVYVYERTPNGWTFHDILESPSRTSTKFGESLATDGEVLIVGDPFDRWENLQLPDGLAFVYRFDGTRWRLQQALRPVGAQGGAIRFGGSVRIDDGRALISATGDNSVGWTGGRYYIYDITSTGLVLTASLVPPEWVGPGNGNFRVHYNESVDLSGNTIAYKGRSHINFLRKTAAGWIPDGYAERPAGSFYEFGYDVAIDGDVMAVGRTGQSPTAPRRGRVEFYERPSAGVLEWTHVQGIEASNASIGAGASDYFGRSIDMDGDILAVGASEGMTFSGQPNGQVYILERDATSGIWVESARLTSEHVESHVFGAGGDLLFGMNVRLSDGVVVAPDYGANVVGNAEGMGRVFIYERQVGDLVCAGQANSASTQGASLSVNGSTNASFGYLTFGLGQLPAGTSAILLAARSAGVVPVGAGILCLGSDVARVPGGLLTADAMGTAVLQLGHQDIPMLAPQPGEKILFQAWYRDVGSGGSNLTDSVIVEFE